LILSIFQIPYEKTIAFRLHGTDSAYTQVTRRRKSYISCLVRMDKFLLLRDRSGLIQLRLPEGEHALRFGLARLPLESVVEVRGTVRARPAGQENPQLATGRVEVELSAVVTALPAKPNLPFQQRERILPKVAKNIPKDTQRLPTTAFS
jgi:aspartyl-tRNA synthetase